MTLRLVFFRAVWLLPRNYIATNYNIPIHLLTNTVSTMDSLEEALISTIIALPHPKTKNIEVRV
jgi:hypothetical protein